MRVFKVFILKKGNVAILYYMLVCGSNLSLQINFDKFSSVERWRIDVDFRAPLSSGWTARIPPHK